MRFSELDGRTVAVWGLGRETRSFAAHLAARLPSSRLAVIVREDAGEDVPANGARVVSAERAVEAVAACDVLVRSPGVSIHKPALRALRDRGTAVTTATSLWLAERGGRRVIGVTGTKGKSTTATLIAHLITAGAGTAHLAGNIGIPALDLLDVPDSDWIVAELSSFQLADLAQGPEVAVITALFNEHVDWHGSAEAYRREKLRIAALPCVEACVYPEGQAEIEAAIGAGVRRCRFGGAQGWHVTETGIADGRGREIAIGSLPLRGRHNAENLCCALTALDAAGLPEPPLPEVLGDVRPLPHRLQTVHVAAGVEFVDDSISTTPESTMAAIDAFPDRPLVLIAGGHEREQDYAGLGALAARRRLELITMPVTGERLAEAATRAGLHGGHIHRAPDMASAVELARELAPPGAVVLLSPAAPSYNTYRNFEERGRHFAELVAGGLPQARLRSSPTPSIKASTA
jgi:UDP-N-acetylmuramoylalanine--D-glutamate ligase